MIGRVLLLIAACAVLALGGCGDDAADARAFATDDPSAPLPAPRDPTAITGRIVDVLGQPVPGCTLTLRCTQQPRPDLRSTTAATGQFSFSAPTAGGPLILVVTHPRFPPLVIDAEPGADLGDVELASAIGCEVRVTRAGPPGPAGVADARISLEPLLFDPRLVDATLLRRTTRSEADGRAVLYGIPPGTWRIRVEAPGLATVERVHVQPSAPETPPLVPVPMADGHRLVGRVADPSGAPVAGAQVEVLGAGPDAPGARARTSEDGSFRLTGLAAGARRLVATRAPDLRVEAEVVVPTRDPLELHLAPARPVTGRVVDAETGIAIPGASVTATPLDRADASAVAVRTGPDGQFDLGRPVAGRYGLEFASNGYVPVNAGVVDLPDTVPLELAMLPAAEVAGKVLDASGRPLPGAEIEMVPAAYDGSAFAQFTLDAQRRARVEISPSAPDGAFRATVPQGTFRFVVRAAGHAPLLTGPIDASREPTTRATLRLSRGATVRGTARGTDGSAAAAVVVCLDPLPGGEPDRLAATTIAGPDGRFEFGPISAGPYELFYYSPDPERRGRALARDRTNSARFVVVRDDEPLLVVLTAR